MTAPALTDPGVLTAAECEALTRRVLEMLTASRAEVEVSSEANGGVEFARGDTHVASQTHSVGVKLRVELAGRQAVASTNQIDEAGLRALVARVEAVAHEHQTPGELSVLPPQSYPEGPPLFFEASRAAMAAEARAAVAQRAIEAAQAAGLVVAGDVQLEARARAVHNTAGLLGYEVMTYGEFSMTARSAEHRGSGWAWSGYEDWSRVDPAAVIRRAVALGARSADPVAIEPGRYTVILEPAAVAELISPILGHPTRGWSLRHANRGYGVFAGERRGTTKIGRQMLDRRLRMVSSPWDPERPASTIARFWTPIPEPVTWFEHGVLQNLAHPGGSGRPAVINPGGVRLAVEGPTQTLDEMIASTRRGIWVNRLSHVGTVDERTMLLTGTTRDGTFLIENGKITKPIKNFRFMESPFFVLNRLEAWGEPVRASRAIVAPRVRVGDFNFSSATDAI